MGADHPGEIADLCALCRPTVGVVTNVSPSHLHYFGTVEALGDELAELPRALPPDGVVVLNRDDPRTRVMAAETPATALYFGPQRVDGGGGPAPAPRSYLLPLG